MSVSPAGPTGDPYRTTVARIESSPRRLPFTLVLQLLFGGTLTQIGWGSLAFSLVIVHVCVVDSALFEFTRFRGPLDEAPGIVIRSTDTTASENDEPVVSVEFRFVDRRGIERDGVSYVAGKTLPPDTNVTIEYPAGHSPYARIKGMRSRTYGFDIWFMLLLPAMALALVARGSQSGWKAYTLLKYGRISWGGRVAQEEPDLAIAERPEFTLTFEFVGDDGQRCRATARTHEPGPLTGDELEQLVYDRRDRGHSTLLDHLPGGPRIDAEGRFYAPSRFVALLHLALPTAVVLAIVYAL